MMCHCFSSAESSIVKHRAGPHFEFSRVAARSQQNL